MYAPGRSKKRLSTSVSLLCLQHNGQDRSHDEKCKNSCTDTCLFLYLGSFAYKNSTRISSVSDSTCAMLTNDQIYLLQQEKKSRLEDRRRLNAFEFVLFFNCKTAQKSRLRSCSRWTRSRSHAFLQYLNK